MNTRRCRTSATSAAIILASAAMLSAHSGPPFPVVSNAAAQPYAASVWTDPDATDDGSAGGQFWIVLGRIEGSDPLPSNTRATITVRPLGTDGPEQTAEAMPVRGDVANQFAGVVLDHEGPFAVHVSIDGPLGPATINTQVDATYDLRPPRIMILVYVAPFLLAGGLWAKLLLRRRHLLSGPKTQ